MFNFNHLYYFYVIAKSGGVNAAASRLHISQPSLTSQVKTLEESLKMRLFYKAGRNNQLTEDGFLVYGICQKMFETMEQLEGIMLERVNPSTRRLSIGVSEEIDRLFAFDVINLFLKKSGANEQPKIVFKSNKHYLLAEKLKFHELDALITHLPMIDPELVSLEKVETPVSLVCSRQLKIQPQKNIESSALIKELGETTDWILPSQGLQLRSEISQFLGEDKIKGRIVFESDMITMILQSVNNGMGVAFLPLLYIPKNIRDKTVRIIGPKDGYWKHPISLACHPRNKNDLLIKTLLTSFKEVCNRALQ